MELHFSTLAGALNAIAPDDHRRRAALAFIYAELLRLKPSLRAPAHAAEDAVQIVASTLWRRGLQPRVRTEGQSIRLLRVMLTNASTDRWRRASCVELADDLDGIGATHLTPERMAILRQRLKHVAHATSLLHAGGSPAITRRLDRMLRANGVIHGEGDLPPGRNSAEAKAEYRAVKRHLERRRPASDAIDEATVALLVAMRDLRGKRGD